MSLLYIWLGCGVAVYLITMFEQWWVGEDTKVGDLFPGFLLVVLLGPVGLLFLIIDAAEKGYFDWLWEGRTILKGRKIK